MNQVHLGGNICSELDLRQLQNDKQVLNFRIAVDRKFKRGDETVKETAFIDCEVWDSGAGLIHKHFQKGDAIYVNGSIKQDDWEDKATGQKRSKLKVRVEKFDFPLGNSRKQNDGDSAPAEGKPEKRAAKKPPKEDLATVGSTDDDAAIPF